MKYLWATEMKAELADINKHVVHSLYLDFLERGFRLARFNGVLCYTDNKMVGFWEPLMLESFYGEFLIECGEIICM